MAVLPRLPSPSSARLSTAGVGYFTPTDLEFNVRQVFEQQTDTGPILVVGGFNGFQLSLDCTGSGVLTFTTRVLSLRPETQATEVDTFLNFAGGLLPFTKEIHWGAHVFGGIATGQVWDLIRLQIIPVTVQASAFITMRLWVGTR